MDPNALIRKWLVAGLPSSRVSVAVLPEYDEQNDTGFRPEDGPWIVVGVSGGGFHSEAPVFLGLIQVTVFAGKDEGEAAGILSSQIRTLIHGKNAVNLSPDGFVMACTENTDAMPGTEPAAGLATAVSVYDVILRSN